MYLSALSNFPKFVSTTVSHCNTRMKNGGRGRSPVSVNTTQSDITGTPDPPNARRRRNQPLKYKTRSDNPTHPTSPMAKPTSEFF